MKKNEFFYSILLFVIVLWKHAELQIAVYGISTVTKSKNISFNPNISKNLQRPDTSTKPSFARGNKKRNSKLPIYK